LKKSIARPSIVRSKPGVRSTDAATTTSVLAALNTVSAASRGCPRRHRLTSRGYPDSVSEPSPKSVPSSTVFSSSQLIRVFASGNSNPSATNSRVRMSNSRTIAASDPPCDRLINASE
jgi:hypothetical protein